MSAISSAVATDNAVNSTGGGGFSDISTEEFIKIIFAELANQDPLKPNDSSALLEQLTSIRSIESDLVLTNKLEALVTENQLSTASNLIGKFVAGRTEDLETVTGFVNAVLRQGDDITLELDTGWRIPIGNIETIIEPKPFVEPDPEPETEPDPAEAEPEGEDG